MTSAATQPRDAIERLGDRLDRWCYWADRERFDREVFVSPGDEPSDQEQKLLDPRRDLVDHSPDGFEWGYGGSGPSQLALAILADHLADDAAAVRLYQEFKSALIAPLPEDQWTLRSSDINECIKRLEART